MSSDIHGLLVAMLAGGSRDTELGDDGDEDDFDQDILEYRNAGLMLFAACQKGDLQEVKRQVEEETAPTYFQNLETGWTPLHAAASIENLEMIEYLLEKGAVWNAVDSLGYTAGDLALSLNNKECYEAIKTVGVKSEFLLRSLGSHLDDSEELLRVSDNSATGDLEKFLASKLEFVTDDNGQEICMVEADGKKVGVMMGWELPIMQEVVRQLVPPTAEDYQVLNIGFGLGIIDTLFQELPNPPRQHVIIEAHPDVLAHMRRKGWYDRYGVTILEGKWQEFVETGYVLKFGGFDAVFTDTFSEEYDDLYKFFEHVPAILSGKHAKFSWFHGLGATNALFYDVYTQLAEMHLDDFGLKVSWKDVEVHGEDDKQWSGTRKYFSLPFYRLPTCTVSI